MKPQQPVRNALNVRSIASNLGKCAAATTLIGMPANADAPKPPEKSPLQMFQAMQEKWAELQVQQPANRVESGNPMMGFLSRPRAATTQNSQSVFVDPLELSDDSAFLPDVPDTEAMDRLRAQVRARVPQFEEADEDEAASDDAWL